MVVSWREKNTNNGAMVAGDRMDGWMSEHELVLVIG